MKRTIHLFSFAVLLVNQLHASHLSVCYDSIKPAIQCLHGITISLPPSRKIDLFALDILQSASDNETPFDLLKFGIRKSGTGTGFPVDANGFPIDKITFGCLDLGAPSLELWVIDQSGLVNYCETNVVVQDNSSYCTVDSNTVACAVSVTGQPLGGFALQIYGGNPGIPPFIYTTAPSDSTGCVPIRHFC
jgi:hypothetical protein